MKQWHQPLLWIVTGMVASAVLFLVVSPPRGEPVKLQPAPTPAPMLVYVTGEVLRPGVYPLLPGSRAVDAIKAAGGLTEKADSSAVNLAALLKDGERLVVAPVRAAAASGDKTSSGQAAGGDSTAGSIPPEKAAKVPAGPVNINTASLEELDSLPGIGPSRAQDIIDYRTANGGFKTLEEIQNVSGIGPAMFERLKGLITLE